ncbi:MAG: glycoside hydrolase family 65 protein, partial [Clostridia bacterium]|nr:glycoside hydrolase family 65 protein [Clostridia bacterium]
DIVEITDSICQKDFEKLLYESEREWESLWQNCDISIESDDATENLKLRLAMYHMIIMCPWHDNKVSIAAKGLTGMGYAGHVFWDCEIFNLPFFSYTQPLAARNLCTYRYHTLDGARRKARQYGYAGAMYPWESASISGDEQCPKFKNYSPDNTPRRVTCGDIEQHVVCDVAYGVYSYGQVTGDREFMKKYGFEILFETAAFWLSRLEYNEQKDRYEIRQITGPDEYKEYVDNDVFTNYMVAWNLKTALNEIDILASEDTQAYNTLDKRLGLAELANAIGQKLPKLYLPSINDDGLVPQNDTYLTLKQIDLAKYKKSGINRLIYRDYSLKEIGDLMVSKQADLIQLFALMPNLFPSDIVKKNFDFYEDKCIHDSSLSLSAFATVAARLGEIEIAHGFFKGALDTDFGESSTLCNEGIHAANCGGIWQTVVFGFAGIGVLEGNLIIEPHLPSEWRKISIRLNWQGCQLQISLDKKTVTIESLNGKEIFVLISGKEICVNGKATVNY